MTDASPTVPQDLTRECLFFSNHSTVYYSSETGSWLLIIHSPFGSGKPQTIKRSEVWVYFKSPTHPNIPFQNKSDTERELQKLLRLEIEEIHAEEKEEMDAFFEEQEKKKASLASKKEKKLLHYQEYMKSQQMQVKC